MFAYDRYAMYRWLLPASTTQSSPSHGQPLAAHSNLSTNSTGNVPKWSSKPGHNVTGVGGWVVIVGSVVVGCLVSVIASDGLWFVVDGVSGVMWCVVDGDCGSLMLVMGYGLE